MLQEIAVLVEGDLFSNVIIVIVKCLGGILMQDFNTYIDCSAKTLIETVSNLEKQIIQPEFLYLLLISSTKVFQISRFSLFSLGKEREREREMKNCYYQVAFSLFRTRLYLIKIKKSADH